MQSITALAHLRASILFVIDLSEQCGYSLEQQIALLKSIKPLFSNKPLILVANKIDVMPYEKLPDHNRKLLDDFINEHKILMIQTSTLTEDGIIDVKEKACSLLLAQRVEMKMKGKQVPGMINRLHVARPRPRDNKKREATIPEGVLERRSQNVSAEKMEEEKPQMVITIGGPSAYEVDPEWNPQIHDTEDLRDNYQLKNNEWKYDVVPEIVDGMNISDFIDPDIEELLDRLEAEEIEQLQELEAAMQEDDDVELTEEERALLQEVQEAKAILIKESRLKQKLNTAPMPRKHNTSGTTVKDFEQHLNDMGIDPTSAVERARSKSRGRSIKRHSDPLPSVGKKRTREDAFSPGAGLRDERQQKIAKLMERKSQKKRNQDGRTGEGDRRIWVKNQKHLLAGKRGIGGSDRR